MYQGEARLD